MVNLVTLLLLVVVVVVVGCLAVDVDDARCPAGFLTPNKPTTVRVYSSPSTYCLSSTFYVSNCTINVSYADVNAAGCDHDYSGVITSFSTSTIRADTSHYWKNTNDNGDTSSFISTSYLRDEAYLYLTVQQTQKASTEQRPVVQCKPFSLNIQLQGSFEAPISGLRVGRQAARASATNVYLAQTAAGTADGSSCANARAASYFNSASSWGTSSTKIGAGTTVRLCGNITTALAFQASGTSTAVITLDGTGATYNNEIEVTNLAWWRIQNVVWTNGYAGSLVSVYGGSDGVITQLHADNVQYGVFLGQYNGEFRPTRITVSNCYLRQTPADLGNTQHDMITSDGAINIVIEGNYIEMRTGGAGNEAHNDGIQTWEKNGVTAGPPSDWTIRYNTVVMNSAATNDRSWMMLENLNGTINIYGNLLIGINGASAANGIAADDNFAGVVFNIYGNTLVSHTAGSNNLINLYAPGTAYLRNNIFYGPSKTLWGPGDMTVNRNYNLWYSSSAPTCTNQEKCNVDPQFVDFTNNLFALKSTSPVLAAGTNLGAPYNNGVSNSTTWPNPTLVPLPATGNWPMGCYAN